MAYSYHGDLSALVLDLRRQDLSAIEYEYREQGRIPGGVGGATGRGVAGSLSVHLRGAVQGSYGADWTGRPKTAGMKNGNWRHRMEGTSTSCCMRRDAVAGQRRGTLT